MSIFNTINIKAPGLNKFDLSYTNNTTLNMGELVPVMCKDMVPGDKFRVRTSSFVRLMPLANPTFQNLRLYLHYYFVPNRLVWSDWEQWITGSVSGDYGLPSSNLPDMPNITLPSSFEPLWDSLGYRVVNNSVVTNNQFASSLRLRAYWLIYNEWYRDQNVDSRVYIPIENSGNEDFSAWKFVSPNDQVTDGTIEDFTKFARRRYLKDYFTSALPWPQRGPDVMLPFGGDAPLSTTGPDVYAGIDTGYSDSSDSFSITHSVGSTEDNITAQTGINGKLYNLRNTLSNASVDLSNVTSATINDLRRAVALQRFFEISARGGSRYIEVILSHFGVHSKDARLQRPEFLGGGVTPIQIGEVLQTTPTEDSPLATMAGRGYAYGNSNDNGCVYRATEHGMLFCIASIVPESLYWQGIDRMLQKFDRLDYYWPTFAHLGEQEIKRKELFFEGTTTDEELFGYAPRYSEYKFSTNELHGDFVNDPLLQNWHFGRQFTSSPALTSEFLEIPDITGPFAVADGAKYLCQIYHQIDALRPMPYYSDPRLI